MASRGVILPNFQQFSTSMDHNILFLLVLMAVFRLNMGQPIPPCFLPLFVSEENLWR